MVALDDIQPMAFHEVKRPFGGPEWTFELKHDGYRVLAQASPEGVKLKSRNGNDATGWFAEIVNGLLSIAATGPHILDGEVCVFDAHGHSNFNLLQDRARRRGFKAGDPQVTYAVFDLLVHRGKDIRGLPLSRRKALLSNLMTPTPASCLYVQDLPDQGLELYTAALQLQLEGIVAKRLDSPYESGMRTRNWLKIKRPGAVPPERFKR